MILVTGGTGMVGHHLLAKLTAKGEKIKAVYRTPEKRKAAVRRMAHLLPENQRSQLDCIIWIKADITDIPALTEVFKDITQVYHCAGLVSFDSRDKNRLRKINIEGTANMVNLALQFGVKKFCHLSSVSALGDTTNGKPINEDTPRNNTTFHDYYAISKYGAEIEVWRASQEGLSVVIVNPAIIIGSGNWSSGSGQLFSRVAQGFPFRLPKKSGFVAVDDVVTAMIGLMNSRIKNERFALVADCQRIENITDQIAAYFHRKAPPIKIRKWMVWGLWMGQCIRHLFGGKKEIDKQTIKLLYTDVSYDASKITKYLDFSYTPLKKALVKTAQQFKEEHS